MIDSYYICSRLRPIEGVERNVIHVWLLNVSSASATIHLSCHTSAHPGLDPTISNNPSNTTSSNLYPKNADGSHPSGDIVEMCFAGGQVENHLAYFHGQRRKLLSLCAQWPWSTLPWGSSPGKLTAASSKYLEDCSDLPASNR